MYVISNCYVAVHADENIALVAFFWIMSHGVRCVDNVFCIVTALCREAICNVNM